MMIKIVDFDLDFLTQSFKWLNDAEIRELTGTTATVTREGQERWFDVIQKDDTYKIWGIVSEGVMIGACGIKHINYEIKQGEYWGYIGEKQYWGGKGHKLVNLVLKQASCLGLSCLVLSVLKINQRAIRLYCKEGFEVYNEDNEKLYMIKQIQ